MIRAEVTTDITLIRTIVTNQIVWDMSGYVGNPEEFVPSMSSIWVVLKDNEEVIGLYELRRYTAITAEVHIYILPQYHGTGKSLEAADALIKWARVHTQYSKGVTGIPSSHIRSIKYVKKVGWTACGQITNGIIYNNQLQHLMLFEFEV